MRIMNLLKNNRILKRSLALLLSVMVLVSAVDVLMVSVFADGNEYSGDAYTVTTNAINFNNSNGYVTYTVRRKKPVYNYEFIYNDAGIPIQVHRTVSASTYGNEYEDAVCQPMMANGTQVLDSNGNPVWKFEGDEKTFSTALTTSSGPSLLKIKTGEHTYTEEYCGIIGSTNINGVRRLNAVRKNGDSWEEVVFVRTSIYCEEKDEDGNVVLDEGGNPVFQDTATYVWEYEQDYVPAVQSGSNNITVSVPSDNTMETYTIRIAGSTPVEVTLNGTQRVQGQDDVHLLFMDRGNDQPDTMQVSSETVELDSQNNSAEFTVQYPEEKFSSFNKIWQSDGETLHDNAVNIGVVYKDENGNEVKLIQADTPHAIGDPLKNADENATFYRESALNVTWTYYLYTHYNYNSDGTERNFEIYESEIPDGYIQQRDNRGNLVNIKLSPFEATITWHDAENKYGSRPDPEKLAENIENLVYKRSAGANEQKLDDVIVLCKQAYQPKKTKIPYAGYEPIATSVHLTPEEISAYNNDSETGVNAKNVSVTALNADITAYNADVITESAADDHPDILTSNFPYSPPNLSSFGGDIYQYNLAVDEYNERVRIYNEGDEITNTEGVTQFNQEVDNYNDGVNANNQAIENRLNDVNDLRNVENVVVITPDIENNWTISMPHSMAVDSNDKKYSYYIKDTDGTHSLSDNLIPESADVNGIDHTSDSYALSISNNGNSASFTDAIYDKADVKATLTGETEFSVYKYWGDNNDGDRPECEFEIYHYSDVDGKSYTIATAMPKADFKRPIINSTDIGSRDDSIVKYVFKKGENSSVTVTNVQDGYAKHTSDVYLSSIPKFDATGRMYIYYVKESTLKDAEKHSYSVSRDTSYEDSPYKANERLPGNYALNGDTLRNVLSGNTGNTVTKTWKAEARQDRSDRASFIIDQYSYVREGNSQNYKMEDYTDTSTIVSTDGHEKMYLLYEMVKVDGTWKYKVKVNYKDADDNDYSGYNYYALDEITVDEQTQNIRVSSYTYTDKDGISHTVTGSFYGEFAHRYVDDIYLKGNNGEIILDGNNKPELSCREEELVRDLKAENGHTTFTNTQVRVLKKTETDNTQYYLYKHGTGENADKIVLNYGGSLIYQSWNEIYNIDPSNNTAKTTIILEVDDDDVNDPILAQAKSEELAHFRTEHSIDWTSDENNSNDIEQMKTLNNRAISSLNSSLRSLTNQKSTAQQELAVLQQAYDRLNEELQDLQRQKTALEATNPRPEDYQQRLESLNNQINDKQNELSAKGTERDNKQAALDGINANISAVEHKLTVRRTYRNKLIEVSEKTIEDYADAGVHLNNHDESITVAKKDKTFEIEVKLVYDTVNNIYVLDGNNNIRVDGNGIPIVQAQYQYQQGTGNVVWLDNQQESIAVTFVDGATSTNQTKQKYLSLSPTSTYFTMPKSESATAHHGEKVLDGFSQDVKTKTENIGMSRYDHEGYEYFYKVYEDQIKTKDDAGYSNVETITDETGTYRIITTDKGYKYESREVIDNGNSIVTNTLIGSTYPSTTKNFSGYFLPKSYTATKLDGTTVNNSGNINPDEVSTYTLNISNAREYAVEYIVYREGVNLGTAYMYFRVTDNGSKFRIKDDYEGSTDGVQEVPVGAIVFADYPQYERDPETGKILRNEDGTIVYQYEKNPDGTNKLDEHGNPIIVVKHEPVIDWDCTIEAIYKTQEDLLSHSGHTWTVNTSWDNFFVNQNGTYASEISALLNEQINGAEGCQNTAIAFPRYNENGALYIYDIREIGMYPITSWNEDGTPVISTTEAGFGSDNERLLVTDYEVGDGSGANYAYSTFNDKIDNVTSGEYDYQTFRVYKEYRDENQELYRHDVKASLQYCIECEDGVAKWINLTSNNNQSDNSQTALSEEFIISRKERSFYYKFTKYPYDEFGTRIDDSYTGTGGVKLYKGSLIPGSTQQPDEEGLGFYDPTSGQLSELTIDVYRRWLHKDIKKVAYDTAEVQNELGTAYDSAKTYYYNKDYTDHPDNTEPKFTDDQHKAAREDRPYYKCTDEKGNFRVIERSIIDSNGTEQQVQHESRLLANSLLLYLKDHKAVITDYVGQYGNSISSSYPAASLQAYEDELKRLQEMPENERSSDYDTQVANAKRAIAYCKASKLIDSFAITYDSSSGKYVTSSDELEKCVNEFLNTHDDNSIINWIKNHVATDDDNGRLTNTYADLTWLLEHIATDYFHTFSDEQAFAAYYNQKTGNQFTYVWSSEQFEGIIPIYKDYLLDKFCEAHPEHHRGNSFVSTEQQNYDVSNLAELDYHVPEELKSPFEFALFNTRVGAQKMDIKMQWTDGHNQQGQRPDALKCMVTASYPVFADYTDQQLIDMGIERVQAVDKEDYEIWDNNGTTYYSKNGKYYDSNKNVIGSLPDGTKKVWDNTKATIMLTPEQSDTNNTASEWIYEGKNSYMPKYTFANPSDRAGNPAESAETYGSKTDGTAISYSVRPIGYYEKVDDKYIPWSSSVIEYSGPSLEEDYPKVNLGQHHTGDVYHYVYLGAASGSVNITVNKYWMDTVERDTARPEIHFDIYRSYIDSAGNLHVEQLMDGSKTQVFPPLNDSYIGVDDSKWWSTSINMPKYTSEGYQIDYYAVETENVDGSFDITGYDETENFVGVPTRFYVKQGDKAYYTTNYNNSETIKIGNTTYPVQYYKCVDVNGHVYEVDRNSVTTSDGFTCPVRTTEDGHFQYINYPNDEGKRYYLRNSSTLKIVDIDGIDYPVTSDNKISYNGQEYTVNYYLKLESENLPVTVSGKNVFYNGSSLVVVEDMVRYEGEYHQLDGDVSIDTDGDGNNETYHLVKPTRRYIEIDGKKYGLRDSTDDYSDQNGYSDILNYEASDLLNHYCVIKTGTMQNQGQTLIKTGQTEVPTGYVKAAKLAFNDQTGSYDVGTVVNRPIAKRTLNGNKIWKPETLPKFNTAQFDPEEMLPDMTLTIYRYTYDEIHAMREHDIAIEEDFTQNPTNYGSTPEEQQANKEAAMLLKPIKNIDGVIEPTSNRKYPKTVDSAHLVTVDMIKADAAGNPVDISDKKYSITVNYANGDVIKAFLNKPQAVTHEFYKDGVKKNGFTWKFDFDNNSFEKFDSRGKPYTYVLQEGYTTNIEVWRWKTNETPKKEEKVYTQKIVGVDHAPEGTQHTHTGNIVLNTGIIKESGYTYEARLVEGTDSLDESYTFAYDLEQSSDLLDITNLYNMDQSLSIKLKKMWKGLPENLDSHEFPTSTFKLVRYFQNSEGGKIITPKDTKEDVLFTSNDFSLQEYFSIGESKIFLENKQEVEIDNYGIKYPVDIEGKHLSYNTMTQVYADTITGDHYISIAGVRYDVSGDTVTVGGEVYDIETYNGNRYVKIPVKATDVKKYVVLDNVNTYLNKINGESAGKFNINGIEYEYDQENNRIKYDDKIKVKSQTFNAVNGKININGMKYAVKDDNGTKYVQINGEKYILTPTAEANKYTADCVEVGRKIYLILTDANNDRYIKTGTEYYHIDNGYAHIGVREMDYDKHISWNHRKYSLVDVDDEYYAKIGDKYYEISGTSSEQYIEVPVDNGKVHINDVYYSVSGGKVIIGGNEYNVENDKMIIPIQSAKGYRYNYETDAEDNIISVEVAYTGKSESEIELKWNNLPYYAPNMRPYIYDIEELGVSKGFSVSTLADDGNTDYGNNVGSVSSNLVGVEQGSDEDDVSWNDYVTSVTLDPNSKKDKTTLNIGLANIYDSESGAIKVQKLWEGDTDYEVSPRPSKLEVTLYRSYYDNYVTIGNKAYPVDRHQYIELTNSANNTVERFHVETETDSNGMLNYYVEIKDAGFVYNIEGKDMEVKPKKYHVEDGKVHLFDYIKDENGKVYELMPHHNGEHIDYYYIVVDGQNIPVHDGVVVIDENSDPYYVKRLEMPLEHPEQYIKISDNEKYDVENGHLKYDEKTEISDKYFGTFTFDGVTYSTEPKDYIVYNDKEYDVEKEDPNDSNSPRYVIVDDVKYYVKSEFVYYATQDCVTIGSAKCIVMTDRYCIDIGNQSYEVVEVGNKTYINIPVHKTPQNLNDSNANQKYNTISHEDDTTIDKAVSKGYDASDGQYQHTAVDMEELYPESSNEPTVETPPVPFELVGTYRGTEWNENVIKNLPIYSPNGKMYYYYIVENEVPAGYTQTMFSEPVEAVNAKTGNTIDKTKLNLTKIQNTLIPTKAKAKKQWLDTSSTAWTEEEMLFASKLSGIAQSITYRMAYSTTDYKADGNYTNADWSEWEWLEGDSVEIDGKMYYPDTNPHENNNKQYIRIDNDVFVKRDDDGDYIQIENGGKKYYIKDGCVEVGGVTYEVVERKYIKVAQDIPVKSDVIDGKLLKYVEFSVDGNMQKYDVAVTKDAQGNEISAKVTINGTDYDVTTQKYAVVPYDVEVTTVNGKQLIAFTVDGQPYSYEVENNAVTIDGVTYFLQTKNPNTKYIVIEHDTNVFKETVEGVEKEYINVQVDGITAKREVNEHNEVELNGVSYIAYKRQYITDVRADVLKGNVLITKNGAVKIGYENGEKIRVENTDYDVHSQKYVHTLADVEVKTGADNQKYVTYMHEGEYRTYFIDKHVEKTMELSQEEGSQGKFNDIEWSLADGDRLPEYIMDRTVEPPVLKKVRYMPIEYSLSYSKTNYQDGSKTNAEYNRNGTGTITDEHILDNLNISQNYLKDTFSMGFVDGETNYITSEPNPENPEEPLTTENTSETKNTVGRMKITVIKDWGDDFNRDDYRGDFKLDFKITRSNINYEGDTQEVVVQLTEEDAYTDEGEENPNIWIKSYYVPITSNFNEHILSTYTVEEIGPSNSVYQTDFNNYANFTSTDIYVEDGQNATDVQHLSISNKGRKSEVGSLDRTGRTDLTSGSQTVDPVHRYAAFKNTKERLEFSLTPSKLWYNVNGDMYPSEDENDNVMPEWAKKIFFPDGNPDNLRIRFKLQYQISNDENADKDKWLYVTDENSEYPNAQKDLSDVEPYLEFTVNEKGEISPVMHEKWDNLPKHYYTEEVKTHQNYLYRVQEVLVRNPEKQEVNENSMYILLDGDDYVSKHTQLVNNNGTWKIAIPAPTEQEPNAVSYENVTVDTHTVNGYEYVRVKYGDEYYYAMAKIGNQYNYVTKENNKYYIVTGTESVIPTSELENKNEWYIHVDDAYIQVTAEDNELKVNGTAVKYEYVNGFVRIEYNNNYYYVQKKFSDENNDTYYYVFVKDGDYYVITDNGDIVEENLFDTRYQIVYDKAYINGDKVENVTIDGKKYYVAKTVKIGDSYYPIKDRMYYDDGWYKTDILKDDNGYYTEDYQHNRTDIEVDQGVVTVGDDTYDVLYGGYIEYNGNTWYVTENENGESVVYAGWYSNEYHVTNEKVVTIGNEDYPVKTKKYYIGSDGKKHTIYDGTNSYYIHVNGSNQLVTVSHGVVKLPDNSVYQVMYEDYIKYNDRDYTVESSEEIQTQNTVNKAKASVAKTWNDENDKYSTRPHSVMYEIQYRPQDETEEWQNVDENWLFDAYKDSIANANKLSAIEYQTVSEEKPYFKFDGEKYYVKTDIDRKYVKIGGEIVYINNNKLKLGSTEYDYTPNSTTIILGEFSVQSPIDSGNDFVELNGQRIYVTETTDNTNPENPVVTKTVNVNEDDKFTVSNDKVNITLTVKAEKYSADVKLKNGSYYYTVDGVDKSVTSEQLYIQGTAENPTANVSRDVNNKISVTKNGNNLELNIYKNDNSTVDRTEKAKTSEKVYIKVDLNEDKAVPKLLIDKLPSADSQNRTLEYRFVESYLYYKGATSDKDVYVAMPSENSLYSKTEKTSRDETGDYPSDDTAVTNKIETVSLKVKKTWGEDDYNIAKSVKSVQFEIQRRVKDGTAYTDWETVNYIDESTSKTCAGNIEISWGDTVHTTESKYNSDTGWTGLPKYDNLNREYEYRAVEKSITPPGEDAQAVAVKSENGTDGVVGGFNYSSYHDRSRDNNGDVTAYNSILTNTPVVSKLAVTKEWIDEHDRDNPRTAITLELTAKSISKGANGETIETPVTVPDDRKTISVENMYVVGQSSESKKVTEGNRSYYPDNYYYVWYNLPTHDAQGNPILYTISETKNTDYATQARVTDYSTVDGNNSTYKDYEYTDRTDSKKKAVETNEMYILTEGENGALTKFAVTKQGNGELTATINGHEYIADSANMEMYIPIGDKRYFVMMDIPSQKYVEIGDSKVYVNNNKITLDNTEFALNADGTIATGSETYNVSADGKITVNGQSILVQTDENEEKYVIVNGQRFDVADNNGTKQVTIKDLVLKSATVSPKIDFVDKDAENGRVYASTYLREAEVTPDFKNSIFTGANKSNSATYDKDSFESNPSNYSSQEYGQLSDVTKIDFKDVYVPKTVDIDVIKRWEGDEEVYAQSRPPQGVEYVIQYRIVGLTNESDWHDIPFQPSADVANEQAWKTIYSDELSSQDYTSHNTVGTAPENATDEDLRNIDWNIKWEGLPIYERGMVGVKFEYRVLEKGISYANGLNGLFNYATTYNGDLNSEKYLPDPLTPTDEHENQTFTETIYNSLRMLVFKKVVDPGYIGELPETGNDIYHKEFEFTIKVRDISMEQGVTSQDHIKVQKVSGNSTTNITLDENGMANVTLKHNDEISVFNFYQGIQYEIKEKDYTEMGLKAYVQVDDGEEELMRKTSDGKMTKAGTLDSHIHSIVVTNRVLGLPATGGSGVQIFFEISLAFIMMGSILGLMYWLSRQKALNEQMN